MYNILPDAAFALIAGAFWDGLSTIYFLHKSPQARELNPLFGPRPSTLRVILEGTGIIGAQVAAMFLFHSTLLAELWLVQAGGHLMAGFLNYEEEGVTPQTLFSWIQTFVRSKI